jgi:hypothetical protein
MELVSMSTLLYNLFLLHGDEQYSDFILCVFYVPELYEYRNVSPQQKYLLLYHIIFTYTFVHICSILRKKLLILWLFNSAFLTA